MSEKKLVSTVIILYLVNEMDADILCFPMTSFRF